MSLRLFIDRPVLATVLNFLILLVGLVALSKLVVREYPNIDVPVVSVSTAYPGASAYIIESQITDILEESLSGIDGVDFISSKSRLGRSDISIKFVLSRDPDAAASDVRDRVARVRASLPQDAKEPVVGKVETDATPFMYLALTSEQRTPIELNTIAENDIKDQLQTVSGVAEIRVMGARKQAIRVWLEKDRMAALGVTPKDIEDAIRAQNLELPAGLIESTDREFSVYPKTNLSTPKQFADVIVRVEGNYQIRVADVARVEDGVENERVFVRYNGKPAIGIGVVKQANANPLDVAKEIHSRIKTTMEGLPQDLDLDAPFDASEFIKGSITAVWSTLAEAFVLVLAVIFLFLQSGRATFIPMTAVPISIIGSFIFILVLGFSINTLTLLALVLAIGLVVDDAIVMLENIYRHLEQGKTPKQAAIDGSKEIAWPIVAMTLTLAAVFAPVAFTEGQTGKLFVEFALTLTGAVLVSGLVALILSPMLCSKFLQTIDQDYKPRGPLAWFNGLVDVSRHRYQQLLTPLLHHRSIAWLLLVICATISLALIPSGLFPSNLIKPLDNELSPIEDRGYFFTIAIAPEGSSPDYVSRAMRGKEAVYQQMDAVRSSFIIAGYPNSTQGISFAPLKPYDQREQHVSEATFEAMMGFFMIPDIFAFAMAPQSLGANSSPPISIMLKSTGSYHDLLDVGNVLMMKMNENPGINQVRLDLRLNTPEFEVDIDRAKAADLGIDIVDISRALETLLGGREISRYKINNEQYNVVAQMSGEQRNAPQQLNDIYLKASNGEMVPLANIITLSQTTTANELPHFDKYRAANITAGINSGYSLGQALSFIKSTLADIDPETQLDYVDTSREFIESGNTLIMAMILALLFIYLVLSAQFESFVDPLIILTAVLPAFLGALIALKLSGGTLNIYSKIGLIALVGLISKHGILMVEFANQAMAQGKNKMDAIIEAAQTRYRPILMTAAATVLGALPLAFAHGPGAETRQEIGWVIVGGLSLGTALTLLIVPVVFISLSRRKPL